ncbi:MAG: PAS domain S-box protein [Candidatus Zixiibacteriota bacterium]|nr:MAG: PAS domain S-box protein [candidate division Zixibacteria bacterium]
MDGKENMEVEHLQEIEKFIESYTSFSKIVNKIQRQYLSLKETYTRQSRELQSVNESLQALMKENRTVTEFLNGILNSLSSGVIAIEKSGMISHMNPAARKILGIEENCVTSGSMHYDEALQAVENQQFSAVETIATESPLENREKKIRTCHGAVLTLSISTSLLRNRNGEIVGAVELLHDISKMKKLEEQLAQMKVLASLGEMAASIAHQIRNPLAGIGGFASLLTRDLDAEPSQKKMAQKIVEGVESINSTIQTLLDFARREKVEKTVVDLKAYMNDLLDGFGMEYGFEDADKRIKRNLASGKVIHVELDSELFKQALVNLIKNGLEAGGADTEVEVGIGEIPIQAAKKQYGGNLDLLGSETVARISVADNGPGLPEGELNKLFAPFYSRKENGIGLGLSICWKIIQAHGGDIVASSGIGRGTEFSILLPVKSG